MLLIIFNLIRYKSYFTNFHKKLIKGGSSFNNIFDLTDIKGDGKPSNIYIGSGLNQDFITYTNSFKLKLKLNFYPYSNEDGYLHIGYKCPKLLSNKCYLNKSSSSILPLVYINNDKNKDYSLWTFDNIGGEKDNYIYYGSEILIRSLNKKGGYICICDEINNISDYKDNVDIFCFNNINDALIDGKWMIIPSHPKLSFNNKKEFNLFNDSNETDESTMFMDVNGSPIYFNFYKNMNNNYYDFSSLKSKKIPIKTTDKFNIINTKKINGKYVYLNIWHDKIIPNCSFEAKKDLNLAVGMLNGKNISNKLMLKYDNAIKSNIIEFEIQPNSYDINVNDTLFVEGSLQLGSETITLETLRNIKRIPYFFKDELCLNNEDNSNTVCINKNHIEILNGSRPLTIKSNPPLKPFILYSQPNFNGRKLRIGFNYSNTENLPFIENRNKWLNPGDDGKWLSLEITGDYKVMIFSKPNFGKDENDENMELLNEQIKKEMEIFMEEEQLRKELGITQSVNLLFDTKKNNISKKDNIPNNISNLYYLAEYPGIKDIRKLGSSWNNGIRSIKFFRNVGKDIYGPMCINYNDFTYNKNKSTKLKRYRRSSNQKLFDGIECQNGNISQDFYLKKAMNGGETASNIFEADDENHLHFHKHMFDE